MMEIEPLKKIQLGNNLIETALTDARKVKKKLRSHFLQFFFYRSWFK